MKRKLADDILQTRPTVLEQISEGYDPSLGFSDNPDEEYNSAAKKYQQVLKDFKFPDQIIQYIKQSCLILRFSNSSYRNESDLNKLSTIIQGNFVLFGLGYFIIKNKIMPVQPSPTVFKRFCILFTGVYAFRIYQNWAFSTYTQNYLK